MLVPHHSESVAHFLLQYLGWGVAATATPLVMLLAGGTFFWTSMLARVGGAAASLAAAGATAGAVTQASGLGQPVQPDTVAVVDCSHVAQRRASEPCTILTGGSS